MSPRSILVVLFALLLAAGIAMLAMTTSVSVQFTVGRRRAAPADPAPRAQPRQPLRPAPAPPPAVRPAPPAAPAPPPQPPAMSPRSTKLSRLRDLDDQIGLPALALELLYPSRLPARVKPGRSIHWDGWLDPDRLVRMLPRYRGYLEQAPPIPEVDGAARAYLAHLEMWAPRWASLARYFDRGEFHADKLARGRADDTDVRRSLAEATRLRGELVAALDPLWRAEIADVQQTIPGSDLAAFDRASEACRAMVVRGLARRPDRHALAEAIAACESQVEAMRVRRFDSDVDIALFYMGSACNDAKAGDLDLLADLWKGSRSHVARSELSRAQAEQPELLAEQPEP